MLFRSEDLIGNPVNTTGGQRVDFDSYTATHLDGFDFIPSIEPVIFDLVIDNVRYPNLVFFPSTDNGGAISPSGAMPFGLIAD